MSWYFYIGLGFAVGFLCGLWAKELPIIDSHIDCDERYARMSQKLHAEIESKEAEIQRLIHSE